MKLNHFEALAALGYVNILPIIPFDAKLSPLSRVREGDKGKVPGKKNGSGEWSGYPAWQELGKPGKEDLAKWGKWTGAGVGLACGKLIAFDIDVMDADVSRELSAHVRRMVGESPSRTGRPPKVLLAYRCSEDTPKRRIKFRLPDGSEHAVELLGKGQQFVAHGVHPGTKRRYRWSTPSATLPRYDSLIELSPGMLNEVWDSLKVKIEALGGVPVQEARGSSGGGRKLIGHDSLTGDPDLLVKALQALPNTLSYDDWIKMCAAIKAGFGGQEAYYAHFESWCLKYEGNTPEDARKRWASVIDSELGFNYVLDMARDAGFNDAVEIFETIDVDPAVDIHVDKSRQVAKDAMFARYIFVEEVKRFVDTQTGNLLDKEQFNLRLPDIGHPSDSKKCAAMVYMKDLDSRRCVRSLTYRPAGEAMIQEEIGMCYNTWRPAPIALPEYVADGEVQPWLELVAHVIPDAEARKIILDWTAFCLQHPGRKCNWAVLLGSNAQGIGKDLMFQPLVDGLGMANVKYIGPTDLAGGYTDWAANSKLVVVEEMHAFERKEMMNKLKAYITQPPMYVRVNAKYIPQYQVPNIGAYLFFSNLSNALAIEKGDRRFYIYWSPAAKAEGNFYKSIVDWYAAGGTARVARWLMQRDTLMFDSGGSAPASADKDDMRRNSQSVLEDWIESSIEENISPFDVDMVSAEDLLHRMPPRIERTRPTRQQLVHALKAFGGVSLGRLRLGETLDTTRTDQPSIIAIRDQEYLLRCSADARREIFWEQRRKKDAGDEDIF